MKYVRGAHETMVSVPAYARSRGVTDQAIRKRIKSGELIPAMAGGKINVVKANKILNDGTTSGDNIGTELVAARTRKLIAKARSLLAEVSELRANVVERSIADQIFKDETTRIRRATLAVPDQIDFSDDLAGMEMKNIFKAIDDRVRETLTALAQPDEPSTVAGEASAEASDDAPELEEMAPSQLAAAINNAQAAKIEIETMLASGEAVRIEDVTSAFDDKLLRFRSRALAVAGRVASTGDALPSKLKTKLRRALEDALEEFSKEPEPEEDDECGNEQTRTYDDADR